MRRATTRAGTRATTRAPRTAGGVTLTHPERIVYPDAGLTKAELARYYAAVAAHLLADVAGRPLSIVRCPKGVGAAQFFQRHYLKGLGAHVHAVRIVEGSGKSAPYFYIDDERGLLELVQMDTIELHAWGAKAAAPNRPDRLIFDLDPAPGITWQAMLDAAAKLRAQLRRSRLESFVRLTGGKGLHVVAPFDAGPGWDEVAAFCKQLATQLVAEQPDVYVATASKARRVGRIFIDWLRNARGATSIANWSLRAHAGAPVAVPLRWEELPATTSGSDYDLSGAKRRASRLAAGRPWIDFARIRQALP